MIRPDDPVARLGVTLTDEHAALRERALAFAWDELAPGAAERDVQHRFPEELIPLLAREGFLAMRVSPEWGGTGANLTGYLLAMEALGEGCPSTTTVVASSNLSSKILAEHANEEQKKRWLPRYAAGELGAMAFALTEPTTGSDASAIRTRARREGDEWVLDGSKMWITSGAQAGLILVFAKTDPDAGARGISCFAVEKGTPGLSAGKPEHKMGLCASGAVGIFFEGCRVPDENRIGGVGEGYRIALDSLGGGRIGIAGLCCGMSEVALAEAIAFAAEHAEGDEPVIEHQSVQFELADSRLELDAAWLLAFRGATLIDQGQRAGMESSMAKLAASEALGRIVDRALQVHGRHGYGQGSVVERLYRDARVTRIYEGTSEIQRMLIARELVQRRR